MEDINKMKKRGESINNPVFLTYVLPIVLITISSFLLYNVYKSYSITQEKIKILNQAHADVEKLRVKNIQLVLEKETLENIGYLEKEIRNRLNYAKKGETVIVISDIVYEKSKLELEKIINKDQIVASKSNYDIWISYLFDF